MNRFGTPGVEPVDPPMLDVIASFVRTAADDPDALHDPPRWDGELSYSSNAMRQDDLNRYIVNRMDEIIEALNPSVNTREGFAMTLTVLGRHLAERADEIEQSELTYEDHDPADMRAYEDAHSAILQALDLLDSAIAELTPESE